MPNENLKLRSPKLCEISPEMAKEIEKDFEDAKSYIKKLEADIVDARAKILELELSIYKYRKVLSNLISEI